MRFWIIVGLLLAGSSSCSRRENRPEKQPQDATSHTSQKSTSSMFAQEGVLRIAKDMAAFYPHELAPEVEEFALDLGVKLNDQGALDLERAVVALQNRELDIFVMSGVPSFIPEDVAATRPVENPPIWLLGHPEVAKLPSSSPRLDGHEVHVLEHSSAHRALLQLNESHSKKIGIFPTQSYDYLLAGLLSAERPLAAVDASDLDLIDPEITRLFSIKSGTSTTWLLRATNSQLLSYANSFIMQRNLTGHTRERWIGDLPGIRKRGVLRVLTQSHPATYFIHRGQQMGFDFELARLLARRLNLRLSMVAVPRADLLIPWLLEGRGDLIASNFTITPERESVIDFSHPYYFTQELLVQSSKSSTALSGVQSLKEKEIHVRRSSSYFQTLLSLQRDFGPFKIVEAPENLTTTALLRRVAAGDIPTTVADSAIVSIEKLYHSPIQAIALPLPRLSQPDNHSDPVAAMEDRRGIGFGIRPNSPVFKKRIDKFVRTHYRGTHYNILKEKYFGLRRRNSFKAVIPPEASDSISPFDDLIKKYAERYKLDWRLLSAQAYQESRFDPKARSWAGAIGLFQIMPRTGEELGFKDLTNPEKSIHAGAKYLAKMLDRFDKKIDFRQRLRFALASYNAGYGHVSDARKLARRLRLNPDRWFGNVEKAIVLLEQEKYYRHARYGYCRGSEPATYVSRIQQLYDDYTRLYPP